MFFSHAAFFASLSNGYLFVILYIALPRRYFNGSADDDGISNLIVIVYILVSCVVETKAVKALVV